MKKPSEIFEGKDTERQFNNLIKKGRSGFELDNGTDGKSANTFNKEIPKEKLEEKKDYPKCITIDEIWDMIFDCYPGDMENFDTITDDQAYRLIKKFWKKLEQKTYENQNPRSKSQTTRKNS